MSAADARFGIALGGAAIGAFFGYPGLGFVAGSFIGALLFPPEGQDVEGARLQDLSFSSSTYGSPIPILYGTMRMGSTYVWATDIVERVKKTKQSTGGKGGGSSTTTTTYTYFGNFMCLFCDSPSNFPVKMVQKIWGDKKVIADFSNETGPIFTAALSGAGGETPFSVGSLRINVGNEDQLPDPLVEANIGVGLTPAYRGVCTVVFDDMPLLNFGNRIPQIEAVVSTEAADLFPFVSLSATHNTGDFFSPDGVRVFKVGGTTTPWIINSHTQSYLLAPGTRTLAPMSETGNSNGDDPFGFHDVSALNIGISDEVDLAGVGLPMLHEVDTGAGIARPPGTERYGWIGGNTVRHRYAGDEQQYIFSYGVGVEDNQWAWYSARVIIIEELIWGRIGKIGNTWTTDGGGNGIDSGLNAPGILGVAITDSGDVWISTHRTAGNMELHLMIPGGSVETTFDLGGSFTGEAGLGYERTTNSLFFLQGNTWHKWFIDTATIDPNSVTSTATVSGTSNLFRQGTINGEIITGLGTFGPDVERVNLVDMRVVKTYDINGDWGGAGLPGSAAQMRPFYDPILNAVIMSQNAVNNPVNWIFLDRQAPGGVTLKSILDNLDTRVGYVPDTDTDASPHASTIVPGYIVANRTQVKSVKQSLSELYQFLVVEEEHVIKHPPRGTAVVDSLTSDDLGASSDRKETGSPRLEESRTQELEMLRQLEYSFIEADLDYQSQIVSARRTQEIVGTERTLKKTYPVNLTVDEAQRRVEIGLHQAWMDRVRYKFSLRPLKMLLSPGDVITVVHEGQGHVITLTEVDFGANNLVECAGMGFPFPAGVIAAQADTITTNIQTLNASTMGGSSGAFIPGTIDQVLNPTKLLMLDIPLLADAFDTFPSSGVTIAASGISPGLQWDGANITKAVDLSGPFVDWNLYSSAQRAQVGAVTSALGRIPVQDNNIGRETLYTLLDTTNSVSVVFDPSITFSSVTFQQITEGQNAFLIGDEIVQVMTVVDNGNGSWTFSNLMRGRKGTEENDVHTANEKVVVLTPTNVQIFDTPLTELDIIHYYKAFTINGSAEIVSTASYSDTGRIIAPRPVGHVSGSKTGSDWTITYKRRGRFSSNLQETDGVPLAQTSHDYEVDILDEDETTVIRTITTTASANGSVVTLGATVDDPVTVTYDQLDIEADFSESPVVSPYPLYRIACRIYQLETSLGTANQRGFVKTARLEAFPDPIADDANFANVSLLLHCNSLTPRDKGPKKQQLNQGISIGSAVTLQSGRWFIDRNSQYGTAVLGFSNVANSEIRISRSVLGDVFDFGSGDFTLEAWLHQTQEQNGTIIGVWESTGGNLEWIWLYDTSGTDNGALDFSWTVDGSTTKNGGKVIPSGNPLGLQHIAFVRNGTSGHFYQNGVELVTGTTPNFATDTIFSGGTADLVIGSTNTPGTRFIGNLDSIRVTKGLARYTGSTHVLPSTRFANN